MKTGKKKLIDRKLVQSKLEFAHVDKPVASAAAAEVSSSNSSTDSESDSDVDEGEVEGVSKGPMHDTFDEVVANFQLYMKYLDKYGFVMIPHVLPPEMCDDLFKEMTNLIFSSSPNLDINDPKTWTSKNYPYHLHGIFQYYIAHRQFMWDVRQFWNTVKVFQLLWQYHGIPEHLAKDQVSSFDAMCLHLSSEKKINVFRKSRPWPHADQTIEQDHPSFMRKMIDDSKLFTVQGAVNLQPVGKGDGTLVVLPGSQKWHKEFSTRRARLNAKKDRPPPTKGWLRLNAEDGDEEWFARRGCYPHKVLGPKGCLMLWDSRTIHHNTIPDLSVQREDPNRMRAVVYVSMLPRFGMTPEQHTFKRLVFAKKCMSSHHPYTIYTFQEPPWIHGKDVVHLPPPDDAYPLLTEQGWRLAGFDRRMSYKELKEIASLTTLNPHVPSTRLHNLLGARIDAICS